MSEDKKDLIKFWFNVAGYYRQTLGDDVLNLYAYDCKDVPLDHLRNAFEVYRNGERGDFMPVPATLKKIIRPPISLDAEANAVVAKIVECMNPWKPADVAREKMGETAWQVVTALGGWRHLGQQPPPDGFALHRMKEMAHSIMFRVEQGRAELPPGDGIRPLLAERDSHKAAQLNGKTAEVVSMALGRPKPTQGEP